METSKIFNRRKKDGKAPIEVRLYFNRQRRIYIKTGVKVDPHQWNEGTKKVYKHTNSIKINKHLDDLVDKIEALGLDFDLSTLSVTRINELLQSGGVMTLNAFISHQIITNKTVKKNTIKGYENTLLHLNNFNPEVQFNEIGFPLAESLVNYFYSLGHAQNTVWKYHRVLKTMLRIARGHNLVTAEAFDSFRGVTVKLVEPKKDPLTLDEVKKIYETDFIPRVNLTRDMFVFSCLTGLRHSDLQALTMGDFSNGEFGLVLSRKNIKVGDVDLPLDILFSGLPGKVIQSRLDGKIFRGVYNSEANTILKEIAKQTGINKRLTMHIGRHTFLTLLAQKTGDVFKVMQYGGIAKISTAQVYIHLAGKMDHSDLKEIKW